MEEGNGNLCIEFPLVCLVERRACWPACLFLPKCPQGFCSHLSLFLCVVHKDISSSHRDGCLLSPSTAHARLLEHPRPRCSAQDDVPRCWRRARLQGLHSSREGGRRVRESVFPAPRAMAAPQTSSKHGPCFFSFMQSDAQMLTRLVGLPGFLCKKGRWSQDSQPRSCVSFQVRWKRVVSEG